MLERAIQHPIGFRAKRIEEGYIVTIQQQVDLIVALTDTKKQAKTYKEVIRYGGLTSFVDFEVDGRQLILSTYGIHITDSDQKEATDIVASINVGNSVVNLYRLRDRDVHEPHYPEAEFLIPLGGPMFVGYGNRPTQIAKPSYIRTGEPHSFHTNGIGIAFIVVT